MRIFGHLGFLVVWLLAPMPTITVAETAPIQAVDTSGKALEGSLEGVIWPPIGYVVLTAGPSVRRAILFAANSLTMAAAAYSLPLGNWRWPDSRFPEIEPRC